MSEKQQDKEKSKGAAREKQAHTKLATLEGKLISSESPLLIAKESGYIMIREDRVRIWQLEEELYERSRSGWQTPLGVFASLFAALCTANFSGSSWFDGALVKGMFVCACLGAGGWLAWGIWRSITAEKHEDLLTFLRRETEEVEKALRAKHPPQGDEGDLI